MASLYIFFVFNFLHPIHISFCGIDINTKTQKGIVVLKTLKSDVEKALSNEKNKSIVIDTSDVNKNYIISLMDYLQKKISINGIKSKIWNKSIDISFFQEEMMIKSEFEIKENMESFEIENSFLTEINEGQKNFTIFTLNGEEKGYELSSEKCKQKIELK